jgi:hypothetical protein
MSRHTILLFVSILLACSPSQSADHPPLSAELTASRLLQLATDQVSNALKNPGDTLFRNQKGQCGEVNTRNSTGDYTGFQRFVAGSALVVFERDSGIPKGEFEQIWAQLCL